MFHNSPIMHRNRTLSSLLEFQNQTSTSRILSVSSATSLELTKNTLAQIVAILYASLTILAIVVVFWCLWLRYRDQFDDDENNDNYEDDIEDCTDSESFISSDDEPPDFFEALTYSTSATYQDVSEVFSTRPPRSFDFSEEPPNYFEALKLQKQQQKAC